MKQAEKEEREVKGKKKLSRREKKARLIKRKEKKDAHEASMKETKDEKDLKNERTVFVGNVPVTVTTYQMKKLAKAEGISLESLRFRNVPVPFLWRSNVKDAINKGEYEDESAQVQ